MNEIVINSPAKINFGLNVIDKRPDGYHNIETIFYPINLFDIITIQKSDSFSFTSSNDILKNDSNNLAVKAKDLLESQLNIEFKVKIALQKNIPLGSGMGGGSSNGASVLLGLNELYELNLSNRYLLEIALYLGADVPFFLDPKPKFAESKGEVLKEINFEINFPILIVNPGIIIPTKWAYENVKPVRPIRSLQEIIVEGIDNYFKIIDIVVNDFEEPVFEKFPEIEEIKSDLYFLGASFALMTGSGSTLFGIFPNLETATLSENILKQKYFTFIHYENK